MIIRVTVADNDFTNYLKSFLISFKKLKLTDTLTNNETTEFYMKFFEYNQKDDYARNLLSKDSTEVLSQDDKDFLLKYIEDLFSFSVRACEYKKYLIDNFKIDILTSFVEKWENGECIYYFAKSGKYIEQ